MLIPCKEYGKKLVKEVKEFVEKLDFQPVVYDILAGNNEAAKWYMETKKKIGKKMGIEVISKFVDADENSLKSYLDTLSKKDDVHGIMVERPLPSGISAEIFSHIHWTKDIDGQNPKNLGRIMYGMENLAPSTPKSVAYFLDEYLGDLSGKNVCIINRSVTVGRPLAEMLLNRNATVTVCHSKTRNIKEITLSSDIVVVAVGKPEFLTEDMVKNDAIVIDVGTNVVDGKLVGDASLNIKEKAYLTPVPGGIGYITSRMIFKNLVEALKLQMKIK